MKTLVVTACFFLSFQALAQTTVQYIIKSPNKKKGLYTSFEQFQFNLPSDTVLPLEAKKAGSNPDRYKLQVQKNGKLTTSIDYWGFCDGKDTYLFSGVYSKFKNRYVKVLAYGKYCIVTDLTNSHTAVKDGRGIAVALGGVLGAAIASQLPNQYYDLYVIDIELGEVYEVTEGNIQDLIGFDQEL